jgi:hypothetical protein
MSISEFNFIVNAKDKNITIKTPFINITYDLGTDFSNETEEEDGTIIFYRNFLINIFMNENAYYYWYNSNDKENTMSYNCQTKKLSIGIDNGFSGIIDIKIDLSNIHMKGLVLEELKKLVNLN